MQMQWAKKVKIVQNDYKLAAHCKMHCYFIMKIDVVLL